MRNPTLSALPTFPASRGRLLKPATGAAFAAFIAFIALAGGTGSLRAATLGDDQFIDGGLTDGADALDLSWTSISVTTLTVGAFNTTGNTSDGLRYDATATFSTAKGAFANTTALAIGESITMSFDFRLPGGNNSDTAGLRFGLGSSSNTYSLNIGTGSSSGGAFVQFGPNTVAGTGTAYTTTGTPVSINNTAAHTFSLTLTRASSNTLSFLGSVDGSSFSASMSNTISNFTFNSIIIGQGNTTNDFNIDNVLVTTATAVPEPSTTALLIGAGILGATLLARRRKLG